MSLNRIGNALGQEKRYLDFLILVNYTANLGKGCSLICFNLWTTSMIVIRVPVLLLLLKIACLRMESFCEKNDFFYPGDEWGDAVIHKELREHAETTYIQIFVLRLPLGMITLRHQSHCALPGWVEVSKRSGFFSCRHSERISPFQVRNSLHSRIILSFKVRNPPHPYPEIPRRLPVD